MSESAVKSTLSNLPLELIRLIIPRCSTLELPIDARDSLWKNGDDCATLLALSRVSRTLRQTILPDLWARIAVHSIKELGKLEELLATSPDIARCIYDFSFIWDMGGDCSDDYWVFPEEEGTTLELAFTNRLERWERLREESGSEVIYHEAFGRTVAYFRHEGKTYQAPGRRRAVDGKVDSSGAREGGNGPDGQGEDKRIKNPKQLVDCLVDIIHHLPSLREFAWVTIVMPMPLQVLNALIERKTIVGLELDLTEHRSNVHDLPFWNLSAGLSSLSISFGLEPSFIDEDYDANVEEQIEEMFGPIEVPLASPPRTVRDKNKFHLDIANRTVVAAATTGRLRHLNPSMFVHRPFSIRTLLPFWILINTWEDGDGCTSGWSLAASTLRPLLSHCSRWLGALPSTIPRENRYLTPEEVQSLQAYFEEVDPPDSCRAFPDGEFVTGRYLPWLAEDEELAKQVSTAWNSMVELGRADGLMCDCERCKAVA